MKFKNYKSAIHNFAHSFMSIDYMKSGRLAVNTLIDLYNQHLEPKASFDFIKEDINPKQAITKQSNQLLSDYLEWLPSHFISHNCDLARLETLQITIWADLSNAITPPRMSNVRQFTVYTETKWKAVDKEERIISISQSELIKESFLRLGIPESY